MTAHKFREMKLNKRRLLSALPNTPTHEPDPKSGRKLHALQTLPRRFNVPEAREAFGVRPACRRFRFMVPMRVRLLEVEAPHEPKGRAGCPHPAAAVRCVQDARRRGEDTQPYLPLAVQAFKARIVSENSHLDPLLSSDEGRGSSG